MVQCGPYKLPVSTKYTLSRAVLIDSPVANLASSSFPSPWLVRGSFLFRPIADLEARVHVGKQMLEPNQGRALHCGGYTTNKPEQMGPHRF